MRGFVSQAVDEQGISNGKIMINKINRTIERELICGCPFIFRIQPDSKDIKFANCEVQVKIIVVVENKKQI